MGQIAQNLEERQEFWKPVVSSRSKELRIASDSQQNCSDCGTEFVLGSRFCHVCGADRQVNLSDASATGLRAWFDYASLRDALGQTSASLAAFFAGCACVIAAAITGFLFTATTLLDWQAIQVWRIEWLLAAVAAFCAGVLLKRKT